LNFTYRVQHRPGGIAQALGLCEFFVGNDKCIVILGDNIFANNIKDYVYNFQRQYKGAKILIKQVKDSERYGITELEGGKIIDIEEKHKIPINITRCSNNYGPYQFPEKLIPLLINNCLNHKDLPVYGYGLNIRDWLYVKDHCKAIDMIINKGRIGEIYNVGGYNERTNIQIVKLVIKYLNEKVDENITEDLIKYIEDRKGHDRRYAIDSTKIKDELGWRPETNFEVEIEKTIEWYLDNQEWISNITSGEYKNYYKGMYGSKLSS
jgi:nucleoside-diphosphate-sugar epimerase